MLDLDNLSRYSSGQIKGELALLLKKYKKYKLIVILLSIFCFVTLVTCITLMCIYFVNFTLSKNAFIIPVTIVIFIVFLISFSVDTFYLIVLLPTNKNNIMMIKAFLNEK